MKSTAEKTEEIAAPTEPTVADLVQFIPGEKLQGPLMTSLGISPVVPATIKDELEKIYVEHDQEYSNESDLARIVGQRIVEEIELLAKLSDPRSTSVPEWLDEESENTLLYDLVHRDELQEDFPESLIETYGVPENIAEEIVDLVERYLTAADIPIAAFYAENTPAP